MVIENLHRPAAKLNIYVSALCLTSEKAAVILLLCWEVTFDFLLISDYAFDPNWPNKIKTYPCNIFPEICLEVSRGPQGHNSFQHFETVICVNTIWENVHSKQVWKTMISHRTLRIHWDHSPVWNDRPCCSAFKEHLVFAPLQKWLT